MSVIAIVIACAPLYGLFRPTETLRALFKCTRQQHEFARFIDLSIYFVQFYPS